MLRRLFFMSLVSSLPFISKIFGAYFTQIYQIKVFKVKNVTKITNENLKMATKMFELEESLDDLKAIAAQCNEVVDVSAAAQLLESMDQLSNLQIKFSEQVKQHMYTTDEENNQLKTALEREKMKVSTLQTEVKKLQERLKKANEYQLKELKDMEAEVHKAKSTAKKFQVSYKKKKAQYRECREKYLKYKQLSHERKKSFAGNDSTVSKKRKADSNQDQHVADFSPPKIKWMKYSNGCCDCTREMGKATISDSCIWHSADMNLSLLFSAGKLSDE